MVRLKQWLLVKPVDINNFEVCRIVLPRSPILQADSLPAEPQGKPENTGVGCHCFSEETPAVTGKFGLGIWNEAGQRII